MKYTVIATSFNDAKEICRYLNNICEQSYTPDEVLIVDGGSTDSTVDLITNYASQSPVNVKVVHGVGRLNIAQGYNEGLRRAKNDMVLITGIGNLYDKHFAEALIAKYEEGHYDMVTGPTYGYDATAFSKAFNSVFLRGKHGKQYAPCNRCVLLNRNMFKDTGFFYENFVYAGEDSEYYERAKRMGKTTGYASEAKTFWFTPQTHKQFAKKWKVNAIADMQLVAKGKLVCRILLRVIVPLCFVLLLCLKPLFGVGFGIFAIAILAVKFRSLNLWGLYLRIASEYYYVWYYLTQWKYTAPKFHFSKDFIAYE